MLLQPSRQREAAVPAQLPQRIRHICRRDAAVVRERRTQTRFERSLELAAELQETGIPFPVVADACEALIMQLVAAVERQLEILVGENVVRPDAGGSERTGRPRKCLDHCVTDRASGRREVRPAGEDLPVAPTGPACRKG